MATDGATMWAARAARARMGTWLVEDLTPDTAGEPDALGSPAWTTSACWRPSIPHSGRD